MSHFLHEHTYPGSAHRRPTPSVVRLLEGGPISTFLERQVTHRPRMIAAPVIMTRAGRQGHLGRELIDLPSVHVLAGLITRASNHRVQYAMCLCEGAALQHPDLPGMQTRGPVGTLVSSTWSSWSSREAVGRTELTTSRSIRLVP